MTQLFTFALLVSTAAVSMQTDAVAQVVPVEPDVGLEIDFGLTEDGESNVKPEAPAEKKPLRTPGPPPTEAQLSASFKDLSSDDYGTRLKAKDALLNFGIDHPELMLEKLADPYFSASDTDLQLQLRMLIWNTIRFDLNDRPIGFVGIQMSDSSIFEAQGKVRRTVQVLQVIPDTAAARNGIRFGDHIVEFNGKTFDNGRPSITFQQSIQQLTVGDEVKLKINRAGKDIELDVKLGQRPLHLTGTANPERERLLYRFREFIRREKEKRGLIPDETIPPVDQLPATE